MNIFNWISQLFKSDLSIRDEISSPMTVDRMLEIIGGSNQSSAGVVVSPETAMRQATVYSCVRILSETIAQLPLHLYKRLEDGRERATDHQVYSLLRNTPNDFMTASEFWQFTAACVILRGIACSYKVMVGKKVVELIPIPPGSIEEVWNGYQRSFNVLFADHTYENVSPDRIFCVKGLSLDGKTAISPIKYAANAVGLSIAAQDYNAGFYRNGARPSGILKTPGALEEKKVDEMRQLWKSQYGKEKSGNIAVLTNGLDFHPVSMSNNDAQLLELLGYQRTEICGIFGVPPHMIGAIEKTSSWGTGLAEQSLSFIKYTVSPWLTRIQESVSRDILTPADRRSYYPEFLTEQFLKGDTKNRYESYKVALGGTQHPGFMTPNEVRRLENLPPLPDGNKLYGPQPSEKGQPDEEQKQA